MKKLLFILAVGLGTISASAQKKIEAMAKKVTDKMTATLSLNEEESSKVYEIQLSKLKALKKVKKDNKGDKNAMKSARSKVIKETQNELKTFLGADRFKEWAKNQPKKKKKKA